VGKTALLDRFINKQFSSTNYKATIGSDFLTKEIVMGNRFITLQIWDTAGQERFNSIVNAYFRGAECCFLVFDVTNTNSFQQLKFWKDEFIAQSDIEDIETYPFIVLGNKKDEEQRREVSTESAMTWCKEHGITKYYETSAKTGINVDEAFTFASQHIVEFFSEPEGVDIKEEIDLENKKNNTEKECCF